MEEIKEIQDLIKQLNNLGYFPYQVSSIIQETLGTVAINNLTTSQQSELIETLQDYITFAIKCRKSVK
ncbi:hypothetical protein [Sporomusa sp.]|uniref:hypothetical protein n=1 Tax=Sporomusa sp. TaxID=2078658 RepID=UPI002BA4DF94|nr:hypothetical protein [Sporomusa sp.]HWR45850.1 hypothetical protein [Sporomusa sp.]